MPTLIQLLNQAYAYTKSHKVLWLFGFLLTGWSGLSFIRHIDLNEQKLLLHASRIEHFVIAHPAAAGWSAAGSVLTFLFILFLGAVARAVIITMASELEAQTHATFAQVLKKSSAHYFRIFRLGLVINVLMFIILIFLLAPLYISYSRGAIRQTIILGIGALAIYLPVVIIISLANIFASCYIVLYQLPTMRAVHAAFDLMAAFFDRVAAVFTVLAAMYATSFIFSFLLLGTVSSLEYFLGYNIRTLAISHLFVIIVAALILLALVMLLINAFLNVFTNITWTLFFINIVKVEHIEKTEKALANMGG